CITQDQRRETAAHLDNQLRLEMTDHAVSDQSIHAIKKLITEMKSILLPAWLRCELGVFVPKFWEMAAEQIELHSLIHINSDEFARLGPQRFRQRLSVWDRLIKMRRRHVKPVSFPALEQLPNFRAIKADRYHR